MKQDYKEGMKCYRKAAEQGNTDAQTEIGYCYYLRTKDGGWFGVNYFWPCELDVDNRWYNELVKEEV